MVKNVDHDSRRRAVLSATIDKHIRQANPVASEDIAEYFDLSPATIRNIFAELEDTGYLTHHHTSGGRIPTDKGYRYYVDFLVLQMSLLEGEKNNIIREFKKEIRRLEDALEETSGLISQITHYAGIVSFLGWQDKMFYKGLSHILDQPEFKDSQKIKLLIELIEDKRNLLEIINRDFNDRVKVYIGHELGRPEMENCSLVVSSYRRKNKPQGRLAVLGPVRMEYSHIIPALEYISEVLSEALENIEQ
ncbi:MAG: DeoR family transcriptional regulator [Candidatus Omnitrophica bacterium]|nr:DeoR family transcriptional regulator [Candidatus Omnitrophota bacterium]MDD5027652.1 DeoR family transcriptional regulator [Candidatus Omnitrophota bacterium]MDD5662501.1 DeoR family transcriptional regulator [Candidatus Omnitrophota bacterium]